MANIEDGGQGTIGVPLLSRSPVFALLPSSLLLAIHLFVK